jgi:hypothetical protein
MKPGGQRRLEPKGIDLSNQDQQRRLERVFGIVPVRHQRPANTPDHWSVSLNQRVKRGLSVGPVLRPIGLAKSFQELLVRQAHQGAAAV